MRAALRSLACFDTWWCLNACCARCDWRGKGASGQAEGLRLSGRPGTANCLVVLGLPAPSPNSLRSLRSASLKQAATSQCTKRAARAGHEPCAPSQRLRGALRPARTRLCGSICRACPNSQPGSSARSCSCWQTSTAAARQAVPGRGDFWGGEERSAWGGARSALRQLTRGRCLSEAERSERSEFGRATHARAPQRSRCTHRPLRHEPLPGAACRAVQALREKK